MTTPTRTVRISHALLGSVLLAGDPDEDRFRDWVDGTPDLPGDVHTLLRRRARALRDDDTDTASDLREQVQDAGVVVRDRGSDGQQWRPLARRHVQQRG